jgi:Leucine Rich repeats (2 copies)
LVKKHYSELGLASEKSGNYLAKMFQVEATVAPSDRQIDGFLDAVLASNPAWREFAPVEQNIFRKVIRGLVEASPREVKRLVNSALMAGAGVRLAANEIKPAQGTQVYLVRRILEQPKYGRGSLVGRSRGTKFFTAWSDALRTRDAPPTVQIADDFLEYVTAHRGDPQRASADRASSRTDEMLREYPEAYHELLKQPAFTVLFPLLADELLGALMAIPYPQDAAAIGGLAGDTNNAAIFREAVARFLNIDGRAVTANHLVQVTELNLSETAIVDLDPLRALINLRSLSLGETQIDDLLPIKDLVNLENLSVDESLVSDLGPIRGLNNLRELHVSGTNITEVEPLRNLSNLQILNVGDTSVGDIEPLCGLVNLRQLFLGGTQISDVGPLQGLSHLQILSLEGTFVHSISSLSDLENLRVLYIGDTAVTDIKALRGLKNLRELYMKDAPVPPGAAAELGELLPNCEITI